MPRLLDVCVPLGAQPLIAHRAAAVEHTVGAIGLEVVVRFGLRTVGLVLHRQARQLIPFALIALEVDITRRLRRQRIVGGSGTTTQQHHQAQPQQNVQTPHLRPCPE